MIEKCPDCGGLHYRIDPCRPKLERVAIPQAVEPDDTSKSPVTRSNTSRTEYFRVYMRGYRARLKAARNSVNTVVNSTK